MKKKCHDSYTGRIKIIKSYTIINLQIFKIMGHAVPKYFSVTSLLNRPTVFKFFSRCNAHEMFFAFHFEYLYSIAFTNVHW